MPAEWPHKSGRTDAHSIYQDAKNDHLWVYDPKTRRWFDPEDWLYMANKLGEPVEVVCARVQLRNPQDAIKEATDKIDKLQKKTNEFTQRVLEYYSFRKKPPTDNPK